MPIQRCVAIERLGSGVVTRRELRPDDWMEIWPELENSEPKQAPAFVSKARVAINSEVGEVANA